jgi:hypothetical protein
LKRLLILMPMISKKDMKNIKKYSHSSSSSYLGSFKNSIVLFISKPPTTLKMLI